MGKICYFTLGIDLVKNVPYMPTREWNKTL